MFGVTTILDAGGFTPQLIYCIALTTVSTRNLPTQGQFQTTSIVIPFKLPLRIVWKFKVCKNERLSPEKALLMTFTEARRHCNDSFYDFDVKNTIFQPEWITTFHRHPGVFWTHAQLSEIQMEKVWYKTSVIFQL